MTTGENGLGDDEDESEKSQSGPLFEIESVSTAANGSSFAEDKTLTAGGLSAQAQSTGTFLPKPRSGPARFCDGSPPMPTFLGIRGLPFRFP